MAVNSEEVISMLQAAKLMQQDLYESLPGWTKYTVEEYKYLQQNIGFALHGPPTKCIMVVPKDGSYQPDLSCEISEASSTVLLETINSPACSGIKKVLFGVDIISSAAGMLSLGIGVASLFTPIGPIVAGTSLGALAFNSVWSVGRSSENLIDRLRHDESININNREAAASWLGVISGSTGFATTGASHFLANAVRNGQNIGSIFRFSHDALLVSSLVANAAGLGFQSYMIYSKYNETKRIDFMDIVLFSTHLLFFGNTIINAQFAKSLIQSTQTEFMNNYRSNLRSKNLRKKFNRIKRTAITNNTDELAQNAEVIRYINRKSDFNFKSNFSSKFSFAFKISKSGIIIINDVEIFDPKPFVLNFMKEFMNRSSQRYEQDDPNASSSMFNSSYDCKLQELLILGRELLDKLYTDNKVAEHDRLLTVNDFREILIDIAGTYDNVKDILQQIFYVLSQIIRRSSPLLCLLIDLVHIVWCFIHNNLQQNLNRANFSNATMKTIKAIFMIADAFVNEVCCAFNIYISRKNYLQ